MTDVEKITIAKEYFGWVAGCGGFDDAVIDFLRAIETAQLAAPDPTLLVKIRNVALEEAAQVCEDTDIVECPSHQAMYCQLGDASATRGAIAAAIRERILDAAPQGEGA